MWEVFNGWTGVVIFRTRFQWLAKWLCDLNNQWDYALEGEGTI
jgi:hypothetical protein